MLRATKSKRPLGDKKGRAFALLKIGKRKEFFEQPKTKKAKGVPVGNAFSLRLTYKFKIGFQGGVFFKK